VGINPGIKIDNHGYQKNQIPNIYITGYQNSNTRNNLGSEFFEKNQTSA
jgi:hypothetical protein